MARTSSNYENRATKVARHARGADGQQLAHRRGLAHVGGRAEHLRVKVVGAEKVDVNANFRLGSDVADRVLASETAVLADWRKVAAQGESAHEARDLAKAREDDAIGDVRVLLREGKCHGRAE